MYPKVHYFCSASKSKMARRAAALTPQLARQSFISLRACFTTGASLDSVHVRDFSKIQSDDALPTLASDAEDVYVVSGCARGIGKEFARQLLERTSGCVVGFARDLDCAGVKELETAHPERFRAIRMDLTDQASIESAAREVESAHSKVSLLLNVAGILGDGKTQPGPERKLGAIDRDWLLRTLDINLMGHIMVTQAMQPLMRGVRKGPWTKVASLSARVGSIGDNQLGGWYSYRISKAGLNQFTKTASIEMKRQQCAVIALHPGTTDTDLSVPFQKNVAPEKLFTPRYSVASMLDVVWNINQEHTGGLYAFDGTRIPW